MYTRHHPVAMHHPTMILTGIFAGAPYRPRCMMMTVLTMLKPNTQAVLLWPRCARGQTLRQRWNMMMVTWIHRSWYLMVTIGWSWIMKLQWFRLGKKTWKKPLKCWHSGYKVVPRWQPESKLCVENIPRSNSITSHYARMVFFVDRPVLTEPSTLSRHIDSVVPPWFDFQEFG